MSLLSCFIRRGWFDEPTDGIDLSSDCGSTFPSSPGRSPSPTGSLEADVVTVEPSFPLRSNPVAHAAAGHARGSSGDWARTVVLQEEREERELVLGDFSSPVPASSAPPAAATSAPPVAAECTASVVVVTGAGDEVGSLSRVDVAPASQVPVETVPTDAVAAATGIGKGQGNFLYSDVDVEDKDENNSARGAHGKGGEREGGGSEVTNSACGPMGAEPVPEKRQAGSVVSNHIGVSDSVSEPATNHAPNASVPAATAVPTKAVNAAAAPVAARHLAGVDDTISFYKILCMEWSFFHHLHIIH